MYLPIGLFGVSIGTALLPTVSQHAAVDDAAAIRATLSRGLGMMLMLNVPATIGLIVLARPIVELLFEHGRFAPADTAATASAVQLYALGLVGYSTARIISPTFYALRQSRVAVIVSVTAICANVVLSLLLVNALGFQGLALATSIAAILNGGILVLVLRRSLNGIDGGRLMVVFGKISLAAVAMALTSWGIHAGLMVAAPGAFILVRAIRLGAAIGGGLVVLALSASWLRLEEFDDVTSVLRSRIPRVVRSGSR